MNYSTLGQVHSKENWISCSVHTEFCVARHGSARRRNQTRWISWERQCARRHSAVSCAKTAEPIDLPFGLWTRTSSIVFPYMTLTTCRVRLNGTSVAAIRPYVKLPRLLVIMPHRSTTYVDAANCYRPSSVICRSVCRSVCHTSESCKTAELIEMPFGLRTRVGPGNHVLDGGPDPPWEGAILAGKRRPIVKYGDTLRSSVQKRLNRSRCRLDLGSDGP